MQMPSEKSSALTCHRDSGHNTYHPCIKSPCAGTTRCSWCTSKQVLSSHRLNYRRMVHGPSKNRAFEHSMTSKVDRDSGSLPAIVAAAGRITDNVRHETSLKQRALCSLHVNHDTSERRSSAPRMRQAQHVCVTSGVFLLCQHYSRHSRRLGAGVGAAGQCHIPRAQNPS